MEDNAELLISTYQTETQLHDRDVMGVTDDVIADVIASAIFNNDIINSSSSNGPYVNEGLRAKGEVKETGIVAEQAASVAKRVHFPTPAAEIEIEPLRELLTDSDRYEWQEETICSTATDSWAWVHDNAYDNPTASLPEPEERENSRSYPHTPSPTKAHRSLRHTLSRLSVYTPTFHRLSSPANVPSRTPGSPKPNVWSSVSSRDNRRLQARLSLNASRAARGEQWIWISEHHPEREDLRHPGDASLNLPAYLKHTRSDATMRKKTYNVHTSGANGGRTSSLVNEWGALTTERTSEDGGEKSEEWQVRDTIVPRMGTPSDRSETLTLRLSPVKNARKKGLLKRTLMKTLGRKH